MIVRGDRKKPVHALQWYEFPNGEEGENETWCYTDGLSYAPGDEVSVHGISRTDLVGITISRCGLSDTPVRTIPGVRAGWEETPADASVYGCRWPVLTRFEVGTGWQSGIYRVTVQPSTVHNSNAARHHLFVVRPMHPDPDRLLLVTTDSTWLAYNDWGGSSHYEGVIDPESNRFSPRLSRLRPYANGFLHLPEHAPRTLPESPPAFGDPITYPHMEWAWRNGYSKKYASSGWASYEHPFVHWAQQTGYGMDFATQLDLHCRPDILTGYRCVVIVGHDEYWSTEMRDTVDRYVHDGGHVARFAGNFFWQVRLEDEGMTQICHKYLARKEDPEFLHGDRRRSTGTWESPEVNRPGHTTFGLDGSRGVYAGWGGLAPRGPGGFTVFRPEHWSFRGCGLGYGDILGADSRIFGYEVDGLDYRMEGGLPLPSHTPTLPDDLEIIAMGFARLQEDPSGNSHDPGFVGDADVRFVAEHVYGSTDTRILERVSRGSGMIVHFTRGKGRVFNAGTTEWVAGLLRRDPAVERVTRNVLDRFLAG